MLKIFLCAVVICLVAAIAAAADQGRRVVIYDGIATEVSAPAEAAKDMWVTMTDLKRATRFEVKPQGVCRDTLCFPLPKSRTSEFVAKKGAISWFNLSAFARLIKQPLAVDDKHAVWYFGPRSQEADVHLASLEAPDFSLPDMNGKRHSLADFRGKKVLLLTWASW
jgi:hypothetical protein